MRTKVRIVIVADIDIDEYRRDYAQPETSASAIKNAVRQDIVAAARGTYPISTAGMVRISEALR